MVLSSRRKLNVDRAVAELRGQNLSVLGTVCHVGQAEDRAHLVATVSGTPASPAPLGGWGQRIRARRIWTPGFPQALGGGGFQGVGLAGLEGPDSWRGHGACWIRAGGGAEVWEPRCLGSLPYVSLRLCPLQALEHYGGIDILVSNAAVNPFFGNTLDASEEVWDKVWGRGGWGRGEGQGWEKGRRHLTLPFPCFQIMKVNVTATAMLVNLVVPHMEKRG